MNPLTFHSYPRPQIWGQRRLADQLGKALPPGEFGEAWEISAHAHHVSRVSEGPLLGASLVDLWRDHAHELYGPRPAPAQFPLLVKYLDCHVQLSVQVHPTDAIAAQLIPGERGKTEAWVILSAEPEARIYAGLRPGVTRTTLEQQLAAGTVADCLHSFVPRAGDCLFLPAGTVHAVGGGVLMAEVQQSSDATFRLFDWNRRGSDGKLRALHIDQSLASIDWQSGPTGPITPQPLAGLPAGVAGEQLVRCPYFELDRFFPRAPFALPYAGQLSIWLVLDGAAELSGAEAYCRRFERGSTVLVPASATGLQWRPAPANSAPTLLGVRVV